MKKLSGFILIALFSLSISGCNTISGLGKDIQKGVIENKTIQGLGKDLNKLFFDNHTIQGLGKDLSTLGTKTKEMLTGTETEK